MSSPCPLCGLTFARSIEAYSFCKIWSALKENYGAAFSEEVITSHTPSSETCLYECHNCGAQYFSPAVAGNSDFYRQLSTTARAYYAIDKWDFHAAAALIKAGNTMLEIACGPGKFLEIAQAKGATVCGIDTNSAAVEAARAKGLQAHCVPLSDFARNNHEYFDIVTAFQVIEHIPNVRLFVESALQCLKPGGSLILTVPNRLRRFRDDFEPLDVPPHHLSRWTSAQMFFLAQLVRCHVALVQYEPASCHDCRAVLRRWIVRGKSTCAEAIWLRIIARIVFSPVLYKVYLATGLLDRWRLWRMSVLCVLTKPR